MTSTKIEASHNRLRRIADLSDLAEVLFPGNRSHQHACLAIWITIKWQPGGLVPNLEEAGREHGISRRTLERVRAKMRRLGLIDHVSRFSARYGCREGWVLSGQFARSLELLAATVARAQDAGQTDRDKDLLVLQLAKARAATHKTTDAEGDTE
jgi:hypothetical protein